MSNCYTTVSWWTNPIGYKYPARESVSKWRAGTNPNIINSSSPITLAGGGISLVGLLMSFLGTAHSKQPLQWMGMLLSGLGTGGFIYGVINDFNIFNNKATSSSPVPNLKPANNALSITSQNNNQTASSEVGTSSTLMTPPVDLASDIDLLMLDLYHSILNKDKKKLASVIERGSKLDLNELSKLLQNKNIEVKALALLSLISRDDFNGDTKKLVLESIENNSSLQSALKKLAVTEQDNQTIFKRVIDLLVTSGESQQA